MCILFIKFMKQAKKGEFKLIIATNRDEFFHRPAKPAHFWEEDPSIVGGRDMTADKEGGTWLAFSKKGKFSVLLNVGGEAVDPKAASRGFLVVDYLKGNTSDREHLTKLSKENVNYNKFHLIAADLRGDITSLSHWSNGTGADPGVLDVPEGIFAVGNSSLKTPLRKVSEGKQRFEEIVAEVGITKRKPELIEELTHLLQWGLRHYPDSELDKLNYPEEFRERFAAVCVRVPQLHFGTRTHTIILVDWKNQVDFIEWTMTSPINPERPDWLKTHLTFNIQVEDI